MRIAVTGSNGDLGSHLVSYLVGEGHSVVGIDRALPNPAPPLLPDFLIADVTDFGQVVSALSGCEAIVHLAAHRTPLNTPSQVTYIDNTSGSYNILHAAAVLGIKRVCLASSVNALGAAFSRQPRYDYFPLDEEHPTYTEEPYGLAKWVLEQQADAFARRYEWLTIASMRFHWVLEDRKMAAEMNTSVPDIAIKHLWGYVGMEDSCRACLLALTADYTGHERFYIVAPQTAYTRPSRELAAAHYPDVPFRNELTGTQSFFNCSKAERILGWRHKEE